MEAIRARGEENGCVCLCRRTLIACSLHYSSRTLMCLHCVKCFVLSITKNTRRELNWRDRRARHARVHQFCPRHQYLSCDELNVSNTESAENRVIGCI